MCSFEAKGIFISVCAMYWQRLGVLPYKLAVQKICIGNATAFDSLIDENIITIIDGHLCIEFLNEQLSAFESVSDKNSKNALGGWEKRRLNAKSMRPHSDPNAIREEKRREDKRREKGREENESDKSPSRSIEDRKKLFYSLLTPEVNNYSKKMMRAFFEYWTEHNPNGKKMRFEMQTVFDVKKRLATWAKREGIEPKEELKQDYSGAEIDFNSLNREAWEAIYQYNLNTDNDFRKHFNYEELREGAPMGSNH